MPRKEGLLSDIRVITLLLFVLAAFIGIYVYPPPPADAGLNGNLQYGLDLVGGSSLQLKLNGTLVGIDAPEDVNESRIASFLSDALDTEVRPYRGCS